MGASCWPSCIYAELHHRGSNRIDWERATVSSLQMESEKTRFLALYSNLNMAYLRIPADFTSRWKSQRMEDNPSSNNHFLLEYKIHSGTRGSVKTSSYTSPNVHRPILHDLKNSMNSLTMLPFTFGPASSCYTAVKPIHCESESLARGRRTVMAHREPEGTTEL